MANQVPTFAIVYIKLYVLVVTLSNKDQRTSYKRYFLPVVKIKDYNVMIDRQFFFPNLSVKIDFRIYDNILKIATRHLDSIIHKIFEKNSGFHMKSHHTGKLQVLILRSFRQVLKIFLFWQEDWALVYNSSKF